jgi:hypothetical protein
VHRYSPANRRHRISNVKQSRSNEHGLLPKQSSQLTCISTSCVTTIIPVLAPLSAHTLPTAPFAPPPALLALLHILTSLTSSSKYPLASPAQYMVRARNTSSSYGTIWRSEDGGETVPSTAHRFEHSAVAWLKRRIRAREERRSDQSYGCDGTQFESRLRTL